VACAENLDASQCPHWVAANLRGTAVRCSIQNERNKIFCEQAALQTDPSEGEKKGGFGGLSSHLIVELANCLKSDESV